MDKSLKQFFDALNAKEKMFIPSLEGDNLGIILRSAINELDWYYYNLSLEETPTTEQEEEFYLLQIGVARLIQLSLDARTSFDVPVVMFRREPSITVPALRITSAIAMIEHGRRIAQTVLSGLCQIESSGVNEFLITLPSIIPNDAFYEKEVSEYYRFESRKRFNDLLKTKYGKKLETEVNKKLSELVYPFQTHYIGYDADPILDEYFFSIASAEVQLYEGYDTFHYATLFGGIRYQNYILALTFLISMYLRHIRFAEALILKEPSIKLENILTISSDTEGFVESLRDAINYFGSIYEDFEEATFQDAQSIFEVLSCSRKNTALLARPAAPLPLVIQCSDRGFIRCLTGVRAQPIQFLLNSLRYHFPSDYDKHQQSREKTMQKAVKRILNEDFSGLKYLENIKVKLSGRILTDIDLVVIEEATGTILLCQLKHQELCGADLYGQHVQASRLKEQVTKWFASIEDWINTLGEAGVRASFHLQKSFPLMSLYRLVISKHSAYPLKNLADNNQTAYANWVQLCNSIKLVKVEVGSNSKLSDLVVMLKKTEAPNGPQEYLPEPRSEWIIDDLKFTVRQL